MACLVAVEGYSDHAFLAANSWMHYSTLCDHCDCISESEDVAERSTPDIAISNDQCFMGPNTPLEILLDTERVQQQCRNCDQLVEEMDR